MFQPFAVGAKIHYQCDIGYMLLGNSVSNCRDVDSRIPFGVWDQPPICLRSEHLAFQKANRRVKFDISTS